MNSSVLCRARELVRERRGVAAIEFAVVLPLLVIMFLGTVEAGQAISMKLQNDLTARTVADLASRYVTIHNSDMSDILGASSAVMAPFPTSALTVTVSEVSIDSNGTATVTWSDSLNGSAHAAGQTVTLPAGLATPNTSLIWGETSYVYTPSLGYVLTGSFKLTGQIYMSPRSASSVARINS